jgi:hypothetical protein
MTRLVRIISSVRSLELVGVAHQRWQKLIQTGGTLFQMTRPDEKHFSEDRTHAGFNSVEIRPLHYSGFFRHDTKAENINIE